MYLGRALNDNTENWNLTFHSSGRGNRLKRGKEAREQLIILVHLNGDDCEGGQTWKEKSLEGTISPQTGPSSKYPLASHAADRHGKE